MKNTHLLSFFSTLIFMGLAAGGCSSGDPEDPLKYSKKLIKGGHKSLYENGAFQIPYTSIKLIPPGKEALAGVSLSGSSAYAAFQENMVQAWDSVEVLTEGTKYSYKLARNIHQGTQDVITAIEAHMHPRARLIGYKSYLASMGIKGKTYRFSDEGRAAVASMGSALAESSLKTGGQMADAGSDWVTGSPALTWAILSKSHRHGKYFMAKMDKSAEKLGKNISSSGDSLILSGKGKVFTLPSTVGRFSVRGFEKAMGVHAKISNSGQLLAWKGARKGEQWMTEGKKLAFSAIEVHKKIYGKMAKMSTKTGAAMDQAAENLQNKAYGAGLDTLEGSIDRSREALHSSLAYAGKKGADSLKHLKQGTVGAAQAFIVGYSAIPARFSEGTKSLRGSTNRSLEQFAKAQGNHKKWMDDKSLKFGTWFTSAFSNWWGDVKNKFSKSAKVFNKTSEENGISYGIFRSLWLGLEAVFWDGILKPIGKAAGGGMGYLAVNGIARPAMFVFDGAKTVASVAVEVIKSGAIGGYELLAPTGRAALTALMGLGNGIVDLGLSAGAATGGTLYTAGDLALSSMAGMTVGYGGLATGGGIKYIAVPVTQAGLIGTGAVAGVVVGTGTALVGGGMVIAGKSLELGAYVTGKGMEYGLAPLVFGGVTVGHTVAGLGKGLFDETTGAVLFLTGFAMKGTAYATEYSIKYGASPLAYTTLMAGGTVAGVMAGTVSAAAGAPVYLWGRTVQGAGYVAGKTVQHVLAPVTKAGIVAAGWTAGTVVRGAGMVAEAGIHTANVTAKGATWVFGNTLAAATLAGGTVTSAGAFVGKGLFEIGSALVVPLGHLGGAGLVLGYKATSQIAAHSLLAVTDAAYVVLSLEGPRWVVYAIKGNLDDGKNLKPGAVLNLKEMQKNGEVFYQVPLSQAEITRVVETATGTLPVSKEIHEEIEYGL